ncbi:MAG: murein biosynthesis integral membrane protein MurJ [Aggregatilineales bacterium]
MSVHTTRGQIARSTLIVMIAFGMAKVISFVQTLIIARTFGVSAEYDAFVAANRVPEVIFNLIAGGAIAFAFIPVFAGLLAKGDDRQAWRTASHAANTIFLLTLVASVIAFIAAPFLVATSIAPGFDPVGQEQTVTMMRILLLSTLIFSLSGMAMGILQSHNRFLLPAIAPIMFDLGILFGVIFLLPGLGIYGLAVGAVIGAGMHLGIQIPGLIRVRMRWHGELGWNDPHFRRIFTLMIPRIGDIGLTSLSAIVTTNLLSRLGEGATSAYDWGWRLMQIPETLIGTAMGTVIFPTLAALSTVGDVDGKRAAMSGAMRFIFIATIPSAVVLIVAGRPLIGILEGGAFDASASDLVYSTLQFFALGLIVHSMLEVVARSFFADKDTLTPLFAAMGGTIVNVSFAIVLSGVTDPQPSPANVGGLALANTLGITTEVVILLVILRRRWQGINGNEMARTVIKALAASLMMGLGIYVTATAWQVFGLPSSGTLMSMIEAGVQIAIGALIFITAAFVLRIHEVKTFLFEFLNRVRGLLKNRSQVEVAAS